MPDLAVRVDVIGCAWSCVKNKSIEAFVGMWLLRTGLSDQSPYNKSNRFGNRAE